MAVVTEPKAIDPTELSGSGQIPVERVATPKTPEEVAKMVTEALQESKTLLPLGGGRDLFTARKTFDIGISLKKLTNGFRHTPEDLTAIVPAGMLFSEVQAKLREANQWIPLDPTDEGNSTVGGIISANRSGPRRHWHGTARDWVIATTVVNGTGKIVKAGANVVKNVSGYDLNKLYIGARGTLGILLNMSFKLAPIPDKRVTFRACFSTPEEALGMSKQINKAPVEVEALTVVKGRWAAAKAKHWWVLIELMGTEQSVADQSTVLSSILEKSPANRWGKASEDDTQFYWKTAQFGNDEAAPSSTEAAVSIPKSKVEKLVCNLADEMPGCSLKILPACGSVTLELDESSDRKTFIDQVSGLNGAVEITGSNVSSAEDRWPLTPPSLHLMKQLKKHLDPKGLFAPGTFVGGI